MIEAEVLFDVTQLTHDFDRAGEAYFARDFRSIVFQATPKGEENPALGVRGLRLSFVLALLGVLLAGVVTGHVIEVVSAGSRPAGFVHPQAVRAMADLGVDIRDAESKSADRFINEMINAIRWKRQPEFRDRFRRPHAAIANGAAHAGSRLDLVWERADSGSGLDGAASAIPRPPIRARSAGRTRPRSRRSGDGLDGPSAPRSDRYVKEAGA